MRCSTHSELGVSPAPGVVFEVERSLLGSATVGDLLAVARRDNPRRSALFVSTVLAKHLNVRPAVAMAAGAALAEVVASILGEADDVRWRRNLEASLTTGAPISAPPASSRELGNVTVVGLCETATGLGQLVRRHLGVGPYAQTTRERTSAPEILTVVESHSHAPGHRLHHDADPFEGASTVVLVDDELTTGQTLAGLVRAVHARSRCPHYVIAALVDWRSKADRLAMAGLEAELGVRIDVASLLSGSAMVSEAPLLEGEAPVRAETGSAAVTALDLPGAPGVVTAGWAEADQRVFDERIAEAAEAVDRRRTGPRALVLGIEELMLPPMAIAAAMGGDVVVRSTTRSPIVPAAAEGYPISDRLDIPSFSGIEGRRHLYGSAAERDAYDDAIVVAPPSTVAEHPLFQALSSVAGRVHLVRVG